MITATLKMRHNLVTGFKIDGHANFAPKGQDIICAAVSALAIATSNALDQFNKCEVAEADGMLVCVVNDPDDLTTTLLQPLLIGLDGIAEQHPDNLKVVVVDGQEETT